MKIALVFFSNRQEDAMYYNQQAIGLAKSLLRFGVEVDIFWHSEAVHTIQRQSLARPSNGGITIFEYPGIGIMGGQVFSLAILKYIASKHREYSVIQIHEHTYLASFIVALFCYLKNIPCVLYQGRYGAYPELHKRIIQKIYDLTFGRILLRMVDLVVCKTQMALRYLYGIGLKPLPRPRVINVGLDIDSFSPSQGEASGILQKIPGRIDILYVGKLEKRRKTAFMVHLFQKLIQENKLLRVVIVGNGPEQKCCRNLIRKFRLEENITLTGRVRQCELPGIYRRSRVLLLPTLYEIYGMVILEAMYFGVPVIASRQAGPLEIIGDGKDGIILDEISIPLWASTVKDLLKREEYRLKLGLAAKEKIIRDFLWGGVGEKFHTEYLKLCSGRQRQAPVNN